MVKLSTLIKGLTIYIFFIIGISILSEWIKKNTAIGNNNLDSILNSIKNDLKREYSHKLNYYIDKGMSMGKENYLNLNSLNERSNNRYVYPDSNANDESAYSYKNGNGFGTYYGNSYGYNNNKNNQDDDPEKYDEECILREVDNRLRNSGMSMNGDEKTNDYTNSKFSNFKNSCYSKIIPTATTNDYSYVNQIYPWDVKPAEYPRYTNYQIDEHNYKFNEDKSRHSANNKNIPYQKYFTL